MPTGVASGVNLRVLVLKHCDSTPCNVTLLCTCSDRIWESSVCSLHPIP